MVRNHPPAKHISDQIKVLVATTSLRRAAKHLRLAPVTVASLAAGLSVSPETERQASERLAPPDLPAA